MSTTTFDSTIKMGAIRPPLSTSNAPIKLDSISNPDFEFDDLRSRMANFTTKFNNFIELGRKKVLDERNQFRMAIAELNEDQRMKKRDIQILTQKTASHQQIIAKEATETEEMKSAIESLTAQRDAQVLAKQTLLQQINETQKQIDTKLAAQRAHAQHLDAQARLNLPELESWTSNLCLEIDGAGQNDRLKFIFTHVNDRNWEEEASFELDFSNRDYEVYHCQPKIDKENVDKVVDKVNECRDLRVLLKGMRELFVEALKN